MTVHAHTVFPCVLANGGAQFSWRLGAKLAPTLSFLKNAPEASF
jgi:hypothetical protein